MAVASSERPHIQALTGLRWFAAIAVFFHHSARPGWLPDPVANVMAAGSNGVTFFFVLSGFVIALSYFETAAQPTAKSTWNYAVGRLARIYPLYLLVLVVVWLTLGYQSNVHRFVLHVLAVQAWHPQLNYAFGLNAPGWSIGVEFFLYACFPFLAVVLRPIAARPRVLLALALGVVVLVFAAATAFQLLRTGLQPTNPYSAHRWLYRMPVAHLGDFVLGMIAALLLRHARRAWGSSINRDRVLSPLLTIGPAVLTLCLMAWPGRPSYYASLDAMWVVPAVALCLGLGLYPRSVLGRLLSVRWVVFLGEVSFAFYLVHRPIMLALKAERFGAGSEVGYLVKMVLVVALITVVAIMCHFLVERPAQRFLNGLLRIKSRTVGPVPAQAVPVVTVVEQPITRV